MTPWCNHGQRSSDTGKLTWPCDARDRPTSPLDDAHRRALLSDPDSSCVA